MLERLDECLGVRHSKLETGAEQTGVPGALIGVVDLPRAESSSSSLSNNERATSGSVLEAVLEDDCRPEIFLGVPVS